jgi:hypothetical protein
VSDKLKGEARRHQELRGAVNTAGPRSWETPKMGSKSLNVADAMKTGKGVVTSASGAYVPIGPETDGDLTPSSPYKTHRGVLEGGDKRHVGGTLKEVRQTRKLRGNDYGR